MLTDLAPSHRPRDDDTLHLLTAPTFVLAFLNAHTPWEKNENENKLSCDGMKGAIKGNEGEKNRIEGEGDAREGGVGTS